MLLRGIIILTSHCGPCPLVLGLNNLQSPFQPFNLPWFCQTLTASSCCSVKDEIQAPLKTKSWWVWHSPKPAVLGEMDLSQNKTENRICCAYAAGFVRKLSSRGRRWWDSSDMIKINILSSQEGHSHEKLQFWTCPALVCWHSLWF